MNIMSPLFLSNLFILFASAAVPPSRDAQYTTAKTPTKAEQYKLFLQQKIKVSVEEGVREVHREGRRLFESGSSAGVDAISTINGHSIFIQQAIKTKINVIYRLESDLRKELVQDDIREVLQANDVPFSDSYTSSIKDTNNIQESNASHLLKSYHNRLENNTFHEPGATSPDHSDQENNTFHEPGATSPDHSDQENNTFHEHVSELPPSPINIGQEFISCEHLSGYHDPRWLSMVVRCPKSWSNETVNAWCDGWKQIRSSNVLQGMSLLPVQDRTGNVYANVFCAVCHNVLNTSPWTAEFSCPMGEGNFDRSQPIQMFSNISTVTRILNVPGCKEIIRPANISAVQNCSDYSPFASRRRARILKNIDEPNYPVSFNVLMNFDFTGNTHLLFSAGQRIYQDSSYQPRCSKSETFDPFVQECRAMSCGPNHKLMDGQCVFTGNPSNNKNIGDIDSLSDLRTIDQTALVSLLVNITFLDYVIMQHQDLNVESDLISQIAEHLNISDNRIKYVNVTYESGSVNGSGFQVDTLSAEQFNSIFPPNQEEKGFRSAKNGNEDKTNNEETKQTKQSFYAEGFIDEEDWSQDCDKDTEITQDKIMTVFRKKRFVEEESSKSINGLTKSKTADAFLTDIPSAVRNMVGVLMLDEWASYNASANMIRDIFTDEELGAGSKEDYQVLKNHSHSADEDEGGSANLIYSYIFFNDTDAAHILPIKSNSSNIIEKLIILSNSIGEEGFNWTHVLKTMNSTLPLEKTGPHSLFKRAIQKKKILIKEGKLENGGKVRIKVKTKKLKEKKHKSKLKKFGKFIQTSKKTFIEYHLETEDITTSIYVSEPVNTKNERVVLTTKCLKHTLRETMVMKISFVLLPPQDPASHEDGAQGIVDKISSLIIENQFSLKINGQNVDVIDANNARENKLKEKEFCPRGVEVMVFDDEFTLLTIADITMLYVNASNSYFGVGRFDVYVMVSGNNNENGTQVTSMRQYAFLCVMPRITEKQCIRINLNQSEYEMVGEFKDIIFENKTYDFFSYTVTDEASGRIQICVPKTFQVKLEEATRVKIISVDDVCGHEFDNAALAEGYMTQVLGRISISALACVLITYCLFPKLRNLPGVNTMNLTLALLVAEIIFLEGISVETPWLCMAVAISVHYTFLAAHFWMNVMSFDVYRTFARDTILRQVRQKDKYFKPYALYAWGVPLVIVAFCVFVEFSNVFDFNIHYGPIPISPDDDFNNLTSDDAELKSDSGKTSPGIVKMNDTMLYYRSEHIQGQATCWIWNPLASLVAFGAPIMLIFLTNCMFFIRTIMSISRTAKVAKLSLGQRHSTSSMKKMTGRSDVMLYVRMSTVMGFTWFFGLSSSIMSSFLSKPVTRTACIISHIQSILFNILNISQGIFIFVAFVCNRRVFALYFELFIRLKNYVLHQCVRSRLSSQSSTTSSSQSSGVSYISRQDP